MTALDIRPLQDDLAFGARVGGVTRAALEDQAVRARIVELFEAKGLIVFEDVEPSSAMHVALSNVFGPLKDHPSRAVARVDQDGMPGVIDMRTRPEDQGLVEIDGVKLASWLPWHFDHCYNNELNRAGVLRAIEIAPQGGLTGFCDGIELYRQLSPALRDAIEGRNVLYRMELIYDLMRFGRPRDFVEHSIKPGTMAVMEESAASPRAVHPAVWTRADGAKVLHVSPWMSQGIQGAEDPAGDALLEAVCQEINAKAQAYWHRWNLTDMVIWDNWRMLHAVSGMAPGQGRRMQRTTIRGDYGLGFFEGGGTGGKILEMTV